MEFKIYKLRGNKESFTKDATNQTYVSELIKASDYRNIVMQNGSTISIKKQDGKIYVISTVLDKDEKDVKILIWDKKGLILQEEELEEIIQNIEKYNHYSGNRKEPKEIKQIAMLNNLQSKYCNKIDNNMFFANVDLRNFLKIVNEYLLDNGDKIENQQLTFVNLGDLELFDGMSEVKTPTDLTNTIFVKADVLDIEAIIKSHDEKQYYNYRYNDNKKFYEIYKKALNLGAEQYEGAVFAFLVNNLYTKNKIINDDIFSIELLEITTDILLNDSKFLSFEECKNLLKIQKEKVSLRPEYKLESNHSRIEKIQEKMQQIFEARNSKFKELMDIKRQEAELKRQKDMTNEGIEMLERLKIENQMDVKRISTRKRRKQPKRKVNKKRVIGAVALLGLIGTLVTVGHSMGDDKGNNSETVQETVDNGNRTYEDYER